jgi:hypothetical protein
MAWADYGTEFSGECVAAALSDAAYRTHREAIDWLYLAEQPSCRIPKNIVLHLPGNSRRRAVAELLAAGFWKDHGDCFEVVHHAEVIRDSLIRQAGARERNRRSQAALRARRVGGGDA